MSDFSPISMLFAAAGHAKEAWAKRGEHGGSFKEAAKREAELTGKGQIKSTALHVGQRYLRDSMSMAARRGDYAMMSLYHIAHSVIERHAQKAAHEQKTFELTKMVERGDHAHMTAAQLDHVVANAHTFGGANAETIKARAEAEQVNRLKAKTAAKDKLAEERRQKAQAANEESRKVSDSRKAAEREHRDKEKAVRDAERNKDKAKVQAAKVEAQKAKAAAEVARQKEAAHRNSPEGIRAAMMARQQAKVSMMNHPEYQALKKKELELKHSIKAATKEQAHNQKAYHTAGPGRPPGGPPVRAPGGMGRPGGSKGAKVQQHGGKPGATADDYKQHYDIHGVNKLTGKKARGSVLAGLQEAGVVKAVGGIKRRNSVKSVARRARR